MANFTQHVTEGDHCEIRVNAASVDYGGAESQAHIKNTAGEVTMMLQHDEDDSITDQLQDSSNTSGTVINIGAGYPRPIAFPPDRKIRFNTEANSQGIYWDSVNNALTLDASSLGVANHTNVITATAGGIQAVPATVSGCLCKCFFLEENCIRIKAE